MHADAESASQALANAKIALISTAVFAPAAAGMIGNAFLSKHFKERNFHGGVPVLVSGIAFLALPSAISHGGVVAGFITLIIAATGAWAVHAPLWCARIDAQPHARARQCMRSLPRHRGWRAGRGRHRSWWAQPSQPASPASTPAGRQGGL